MKCLIHSEHSKMSPIIGIRPEILGQATSPRAQPCHKEDSGREAGDTPPRGACLSHRVILLLRCPEPRHPGDRGQGPGPGSGGEAAHVPR